MTSSTGNSTIRSTDVCSSLRNPLYLWLKRTKVGDGLVESSNVRAHGLQLHQIVAEAVLHCRIERRSERERGEGEGRGGGERERGEGEGRGRGGGERERGRGEGEGEGECKQSVRRPYFTG